VESEVYNYEYNIKYELTMYHWSGGMNYHSLKMAHIKNTNIAI
jgi:hypothetical protein